MDIDPLALTTSYDKAVRKIDTMIRLSEQKRIWIVVSERPPIHCEDDAEVAQHHGEVGALLHYARIGLHASHDKI